MGHERPWSPVAYFRGLLLVVTIKCMVALALDIPEEVLIESGVQLEP